MKLLRHLGFQLVFAAGQSLVIAAAMSSRSAGFGAIAGTWFAAIVLAIRGYRRDRRRAAEASAVDAKLSAALDAVKRRGIVVIDAPSVPVEESGNS